MLTSILSLLTLATLTIATPCKPKTLPDPLHPIVLTASSPHDPDLTYAFTTPLPGFPHTFHLDFQPSLQSAVRFAVRPTDAAVVALSGPCSREYALYSTSNGPASPVLVADEATAVANRGTKMACSAEDPAAGGRLTCLFAGREAEFWLCGGHLTVVRPGWDFTEHCGRGKAYRIQLRAVAAS